MRILPFVFLLLMGLTWKCVNSTCVLETDFGLSINCGLKKTGMFRVRNLGGLKGYVGLGIQLADELGFKESLSTLEQNSKRRSVNGLPAPGSFEPLAVPQNNNQVTNTAASVNGKNINQDRSAYAKMNGRQVGNMPVTVPPFRPLMAAANNVVRNVRLAAQQQQQQQPQSFPQKQQPLLKPLPVPAFAVLPESIAKVAVETTTSPQSFAGHRQAPIAVSVIVPPPPSAGRLVVPQMMQPMTSTVLMSQQPQQLHPQQLQPQQLSMPSSAMMTQMQQQASRVYYQNAMQQAANRRYNAFTQSPQNSIEKRQPIIVMPVADNRKKKPENSDMSNEVDSASMMSLFNAAAANNVSVEQLALALRHYHQPSPVSPSGPFYSVSTETTTTTPEITTAVTTTTTTPPPPPSSTELYVPEMPSIPKKISIKPYKSKYSSSQKVMNAPKEYYPVGYDKNFDDNFVSKVDLPDTSFNCGDQKHFPGLYGDEDLGCMVFHVCAFTDDGLTQKSFLCPESTLFDQTILKCNWWFYVDCKSSKKLYDSNIPISKSYQLMKALTFFSSYASGPTVDASLAAATAAVSPNSDFVVPSKYDAESSDITTGTTITTTTIATNTVSTSGTGETSELLDNVSFHR